MNYDVSVVSSIQLTQSPVGFVNTFPVQVTGNVCNTEQSIEFDNQMPEKCAITQVAIANVVRPRSLLHSGGITQQAIGHVARNGRVVSGEYSVAAANKSQNISLTYGTDTVICKAAEPSNSTEIDSYTLNRFNRYGFKGSFRAAEWPITKILKYTIEQRNLSALQDFELAHRGLELTLIDHLGYSWSGILSLEASKTVAADWQSINLVFTGERI